MTTSQYFKVLEVFNACLAWNTNDRKSSFLLLLLSFISIVRLCSLARPAGAHRLILFLPLVFPTTADNICWNGALVCALLIGGGGSSWSGRGKHMLCILWSFLDLSSRQAQAFVVFALGLLCVLSYGNSARKNSGRCCVQFAWLQIQMWPNTQTLVKTRAFPVVSNVLGL